ncbi:protein-glutamine gamma-glutamyltransferase 2-like [Solea senegalensis]|uniref:protein-glutamine gamma-glutamyltransferase n=1 Tax=Solea senegalensis TaxID=28829 RepID=A0AAV6SYS9_SOLSE|nr:protein-glutamine gamma-glutamyltransferase 2 [Solea senegalensis]KAG7522383.1 protein-glutamine gamma-glutamyltransferase 2-like [Solea senegalensis]
MDNQNGVISNVEVRSHENNLVHRTREIDRQRLIVRRGQPFSITFQCPHSLTPKHHLELVLYLGKRDEVIIKVQEEYRAKDKWWFNQQQMQDEIMLTLHSPADSIIGHYRLVVLIVSPDGHTLAKTGKIGFHLLFNPWCKDDAVYLPDESQLHEYIVNEDGIIYMGEWFHIGEKHWNFGQFEDDIMDICFDVLDNSNDALKNSKMDIENRFDPVYVSRIVTAMVNSNGDKGVLNGRWVAPYTDGVAPTRWTGSVPILQLWKKSGFRAVKYGQCWVFAAVACTVLRCLGIPTRLITNFASAHDTDGNLSVDTLINEKMETISKKDSTWNFHCWIESCMRRDDLPKGNDGWQVLDPTPQELSDGVFCCGPCPVKAIKEGNVEVKYDTPFVFAEVNADIIVWLVRQNGERQKLSVDESGVGKNISTKCVHSDCREDVTAHYKYPEGSKKEREVYEKAGRRVSKPNNGLTEPQQLHLTIKRTKPVFGTDFDVIVEVNNNGSNNTKGKLTILAEAATYNTICCGECQKHATNVAVPAYKTHKEVLRLRYEDYAKCVTEHNLIRVKALLEVPGESSPIYTVINIPLSTPELLVQVHGRVYRNENVTAYISFTNPLPVPLKGGVFTVEGHGLPATKILVDGDIFPGSKVSVKFSFLPLRVGVRKILVDFDSDRLKDVKGVTTVVVHSKRTSRIPFA